jgi:hypothetical protein
MNKLLLQAIRKYGKPIRRGGNRILGVSPEPSLRGRNPVRRSERASVMRLVKGLIQNHITKING